MKKIAILTILFAGFNFLVYSQESLAADNPIHSCHSVKVAKAASASTEHIVSDSPMSFTNCESTQLSDNQYRFLKSCLVKYMDNHPFFTTDFRPWKEAVTRPFENRIINPDKEFLNFITVDNVLFGGSSQGMSAVSDTEILILAEKAIRRLPNYIRNFVEHNFYGFVLVSGPAWTGFAPGIKPIKGNPLPAGGAIIINIDNFRDKKTGKMLNLNQWTAFREKTLFQNFDESSKQNETSLKVSHIGPNGKSSVEDNFYYFLLHEMAHIVAKAVPSIHPDVKYRDDGTVPVSEFAKYEPQNPTKAFPFLKDSWTRELSLGGDLFVVKRKVDSELLDIFEEKPVRFYTAPFEKKYTFEEAVVLYGNLSNSCFPSAYAARHYGEDFAETLAQYIAYREGFKNYSLTLSKGNRKIQFSNPIWERSECRGKIEFLDSLFGF